MMIYEPKGRAREYSPRALNLYTGCDHDCEYCYLRDVLRYREKPNESAEAKRDIIERLAQELPKMRSREQVLLSFLGDPYCHLDAELRLTRKALELLLAYGFPVSILSKGGKRILRDKDIILNFGDQINVGATLVFDTLEQSRKVEKNAAPPEERIEVLKYFADLGVQTWISLEPIIDLESTLRIIDKTPFVHHYKVGALNHRKSDLNWAEVLEKVVHKLREQNRQFYIKDDLLFKAYARPGANVVLKPEERDRDRFILKPIKEQQGLFEQREGETK